MTYGHQKLPNANSSAFVALLWPCPSISWLLLGLFLSINWYLKFFYLIFFFLFFNLILGFRWLAMKIWKVKIIISHFDCLLDKFNYWLLSKPYNNAKYDLHRLCPKIFREPIGEYMFFEIINFNFIPKLCIT